jgi:large-conductance mechanosensitive channel
MINIFDLIHYLIGFLILAFLLWMLIQTHNYFSKDNVPIMPSTNTTLSNNLMPTRL